jgi:hypothetical protein
MGTPGGVGARVDGRPANRAFLLLRERGGTSGGYHFRARGVFVLDISTGTVRVERFELTCLGP